jgi:SET domain-containing protein
MLYGKKAIAEAYQKQETSYILEFRHPVHKQQCAIDASEESLALGFGRFINHHRRKANTKWHLLECNTEVRVAVTALRRIKRGEEILLDYFRFSCWNSEEIKGNPWLKSSD